MCFTGAYAQNEPRFRHVPAPVQEVIAPEIEQKDSLVADEALRVRELDEILSSINVSSDIPRFNRLLAPWVFSEYRPLDRKKTVTIPDYNSQSFAIWSAAGKNLRAQQRAAMIAAADSAAQRRELLGELLGEAPEVIEVPITVEEGLEEFADQTPLLGEARPQWLENAYEAWNMQDDMMYSMMVETPSKIEYAYWMLPVPPKLKEEDYSFHGFLKRHSISGIDINEAVITEAAVEKKHWLHVVNSALQFSQAYLSPNWYQGGNNYVSLLFNFLWDVQLNPVWHPNMLFQSTFSYRMGLNSVEDDPYRKYSISQDLLQYNVKFGYKARKNWYYSITGQFKTQVMNNYKKGTETRIASFMTPGDLNLGLGMTYSYTNKKKTTQFVASLAPLSYNLRTALDMEVARSIFGFNETQKTSSEFGSNADITLSWNASKLFSYKSRLFLFTDYKYGMGDWENTFNFQFSKLFSMQVYVNMRYDSSRAPTYVKLKDENGQPVLGDDGKPQEVRSKWSKFMLKEILSFGLSYQFSTKK